MKIVCPQCGAKYELDDSICGKTVECTCGRKWIATSPSTPKSPVPASVRKKKRKKGYDPTWVNAMNQKEHVRFKPAPMKKQRRLSLFGKKSDDTAPRPTPANRRVPPMRLQTVLRRQKRNQFHQCSHRRSIVRRGRSSGRTARQRSGHPHLPELRSSMETGQKMTFRAKDFPPSHGEAGKITCKTIDSAV